MRIAHLIDSMVDGDCTIRQQRYVTYETPWLGNRQCFTLGALVSWTFWKKRYKAGVDMEGAYI